MTRGSVLAHATTRRAATAADDAFLRALYASTRTDLDGVGWPDEMRDAVFEMQWRAQRAGYAATHPRARDEIVELDGRPVGRLLVDGDADDVVLVDVALVQECRGLGIGRELVEDVQRRAAASGREVRLHVATGSPARRLYERLGFVVGGGSEMHIEMRWRP